MENTINAATHTKVDTLRAAMRAPLIAALTEAGYESIIYSAKCKRHFFTTAPREQIEAIARTIGVRGSACRYGQAGTLEITRF